MNKEPSYEELAEALANCVHDHLYLPEQRYAPDGSLVEVKNVDNMTTSALQIATGVLSRLKILKPLDDMGRRNDFTCKPEEFRRIISENRSQGCSYDTLVLALISWLEYWIDENDAHWKPEAAAIDGLSRLGIVAVDPPGSVTLQWTNKKEKYNVLARQWVELIEN